MTSLYRSTWPLIAAFLIAIAIVLGQLLKPVFAESIGQEMPVYRSSVDPRTSARRPAPRRMARRAYSTSTECLPKSLKRHLAFVEKRYGAIRIVSTYRKGAVIAGSGKTSMHAHCRAVDFHPAKGTYKAVLAYLRKNHDGGLGTYSGGFTHIHIDTGEPVSYHHCYTKKLRKVKCR